MNEIVKNSKGERIDYSFCQGNRSGRKENFIVILGHGVTGDKDRPIIVDTANAFNAVGFDTLRLSFSGNGESEGSFTSSTISKEVGDLECVLDAVSSRYDRICYVGHSMGSAVVVIQASKDSRINYLVSLAGMVDTKAFAESEFSDVKPDDGFMWEEDDCPLSSVFMNDMLDTITTVEPLAEIVSIPWLLIHGTSDDVVLPADTRLIEELKEDSVESVYVEGADHSFNDPIHKSQMTKLVSDWLLRQT